MVRAVRSVRLGRDNEAGSRPRDAKPYLNTKLCDRGCRRAAELSIAVRCGSLDEAEDERGIAHMIEHLTFRGQNAGDAGCFAIVRELESFGCKFGSHQNACVRSSPRRRRQTSYPRPSFRALSSVRPSRSLLALLSRARGAVCDEQRPMSARACVDDNDGGVDDDDGGDD